MDWIELPHTPGCLVCGRSNPHGLRLSLFVNRQTGQVRTEFTPRHEHIGFEGIVHGGALATAIDEAMVWAAIWSARRSCFCGEMTIRFRQPVAVGQPLLVRAGVESARSKLIVTNCEVVDNQNQAVLATAGGKYVPLSEDQNAAFLATFIEEPATAEALAQLK